MSDFKEILNALVTFRDERNWEQFHNSKDLALAISIEAAELNELFLWKTREESEQVDRQKIKEELADILAFSFLMAHKYEFDIREMVLQKIQENSKKYPAEKARNTAKKYNQL
ncbi:MAG: nucleotide pyrophosphohydrolase [Bacteroidetes bacterium]|nr:nucleotide pyrophosphohydrolase [Bacteroidota bacterium]